ncbi:MAG TPA: alpha-amylase family glycosyl hydrolase [Casimicrobiaceae bacterium]|nr:alpha-amylase family glycosyl hydrolase [Casimicrobiaceae bacterium]
MPTTINGEDVRAILNRARLPSQQNNLTPSPEDWRDCWIYFLMVDRFNNPSGPSQAQFDAKFGGFQGGTIEGMRQKLAYLKNLGVGAVWFTPVLKNCQFLDGQPNRGTYHGYGIQNFLDIDPRLASDSQNPAEELRRFVDDAHAIGIYVIFDIVLNHTGDVFAYPSGSQAPFSATAYDPVHWRDDKGNARLDWTSAEAISDPPLDATVYPDEVRRNDFFRRQGAPSPAGPETIGDFASLKQLLTANYRLGNVLIRCFQYLIAAFDIDGFRIDTLKYLDRDFALRFGNAIREFALSVGKKNFFTYGEVYDDEEKISQYIGRNVSASGDMVGVDASLDFPLFFRLPSVLKGLSPPSDVVAMYQVRKTVENGVISSHGEATRFFVTFLDNHDQHSRFYYSDGVDPHRFDDQATMGIACLFALPGIPSLYYGTEQGLHGSGDSDENVREALWGQPQAFDETHPFYVMIQRLVEVRRQQPALRYGRFYFRPISGNGFEFGVSPFAGGVLAFSRILNDQEVLVVANTNTQVAFAGWVLVDSSLNPPGSRFEMLFANRQPSVSPGPVSETGPAEIHEVDGTVSTGPACVVSVNVQPMQVQILGQSVG